MRAQPNSPSRRVYEALVQIPCRLHSGECGSPPHAGRPRWPGRCRHALAALVLIGACAALMGLVVYSGAVHRVQVSDFHWLRLWAVSDSLQHNIESLPYVDDATGNQIATHVYSKAKCVGMVLTSLFQLADASVTAFQATKDCSYTRRTAGSQRLLSEDDGLQGIQQHLRMALNYSGDVRNISVASGLIEKLDQAQHHIDQAEQRDLQIISDDPMNPYSLVRTAQFACQRDVSYIIRSTMGASARLTQSVPNCAPDGLKKELKRKTKCAVAVFRSLRFTGLITAGVARLVLKCRPGTNHRRCAGQLETSSWHLSGAFTWIARAVMDCTERYPPIKEGVCIGQLFVGMGYIAAAGMNLATARNFDCRLADNLTAELGPNLTDAAQVTIAKLRADCAALNLSALRQLVYAFYRVLSSVEACTRGRYLCQRDLARASSAFFGVGQGISGVISSCYTIPNVTASELLSRIRMTTCSRDTTSLVKMFSVASAYSAEATNSCVDPKTAGSRCIASVWRAISALGALGQTFSSLELDCNLVPKYFTCGRNLRWSGQAIRFFVVGFAAALLNCPLNPLRREWTDTTHFNFPRYFTFP